MRVLDARSIGEGASGLNGGQVIPGLKYDPEWLLEHFGAERGEALIGFAASTADAVFDLIRDEKLAVPFVRNGWIQAAHTETALRAAENRDRQWRARGADVRLLDAAEIAAMTGARGYLGGWLDRRAGVIDPLAYTLELARVATAAGVRIAERETAVALRREAGGWRIATAIGAELRAKSVVVATNAYSDGLIPGLARNHRAAAFLPDRHGAAAGRPRRDDPARRAGGFGFPAHPRLLPQEPRRPAGARRARPHGAAEKRRRLGASPARAAAALSRACPASPIEKRWFGRVAMTPDHLPHIHEPEQGLLAAVGCQGRGVGLMTALGERLAGIPGERRRERNCRSRCRRSGRSRSTPSARSALPRPSPGTACSTPSSAESALPQLGIQLDSFTNMKKT